MITEQIRGENNRVVSSSLQAFRNAVAAACALLALTVLGCALDARSIRGTCLLARCQRTSWPYCCSMLRSRCSATTDLMVGSLQKFFWISRRIGQHSVQGARTIYLAGSSLSAEGSPEVTASTPAGRGSCASEVI